LTKESLIGILELPRFFIFVLHAFNKKDITTNRNKGVHMLITIIPPHYLLFETRSAH